MISLGGFHQYFSNIQQWGAEIHQKWTGFLANSQTKRKVTTFETRVVFKDTARNNQLTTELRAMKYKPSWILPHTSPLFQIMLGSFVEMNQQIDYHCQMIKFDDGGQTGLFWDKRGLEPDFKPKAVLAIAPGMNGGCDTDYILELVHKAYIHGYLVVVVHNRGIGTPLTTPKLFHGGSTDDFGTCIENIKDKYPDLPLVGMGISMGGNIILNYTGESGEDCLFDAVVAMSVPYDVELCARHITSQPVINSVLAGYYLTSLYEPNQKWLQDPSSPYKLDLQDIENVRETYEFDRRVICKMFDFEDPWDYYRSVSSKRVIHGVSTPTLCLHSLDDPICLKECIPEQEILENENIILMTAFGGGHVDFFEGTLPSRWFPKPALTFLDSTIRENSDN